jgi:hypothetical protein
VDEGSTDFLVVLCTGQLMKFDMAVAAFKGAGIAHQVRAETSTGLRLAMPVAAGPGPGAFFSVLVPADAESQAKQVLSELPFEATTNPGAWDFAPQPTVKGWGKVVVVILVGLLAWFIIHWVIEILRLVL